jgi:hypothetical protein
VETNLPIFVKSIQGDKEMSYIAKITESIHYEVYKEYEAVLLKIKSSERIVIIGDFYGDVEKVIISPKEEYCIMAGCGVIVYYLKEPFAPYDYKKKTGQWKEWYRTGDIWIESVMLDRNNHLVVKMENGNISKIKLI